MILQGLGLAAMGMRSAIARLKKDPPIFTPAPLSTVAAAVTKALEFRLDCPLTHISCEEVQRAGRIRKRKYIKHLLRAVDHDLTIFTRSGPQEINQNMEWFVSGLTRPEFQAPIYYGKVLTLEGEMHIWEFKSGVSPKLFQCSREELFRIVRAVAAINAATEEALIHVPSLPIGTMRTRPVAALLRDALFRQEEIARKDPSLGVLLDQFALVEEDVLARLAKIGNRFFSHQDINSGNLLFPSTSGPLVILDWESGSIAAPGVGLRCFSMLNEKVQNEAAEHYVSYLEANGVSTNIKEVLFVMHAVQVLIALHGGVKWIMEAPSLAEKTIRWGLTRAQMYLPNGLPIGPNVVSVKSWPSRRRRSERRRGSATTLGL